MSRKLVLFDIDGTILHAAGAGRRAITTAMASLLGDGDAWERVRFDGKTDPQIVVELLAAAGHPEPDDAALVQRVCDEYVAYLERELTGPASPATVLPGVTALLEALEARTDVVLGLVTGNVAPGAALKLRAAGVAPERFRVGAYGSDSAHRPDLPPIAARRAEPLMGRVPSGHDVVIIGDTPADVHCGRPIGARALAVCTGSYPAADLHGAGADAVFVDLADTRRVLDAILA
jgi:phosphoglycolate phosphatase-like HAD superfamily hydrolase